MNSYAKKKKRDEIRYPIEMLVGFDLNSELKIIINSFVIFGRFKDRFEDLKENEKI